MSSGQQTNSVQGSVPCGNPKRYVGREVVRMSDDASRSYKRKLTPAVEDDNTKSESELHLQRLVQKQTKTDITLTGHFSEHRSFAEPTAHDPAVNKLVGVHGYQEYKQTRDLDTKIELLRHYGLDEDEIKLKLRQEQETGEPKEASGYGTDPEIQAQKLLTIDKKIEEKERQLQQPFSTKGQLRLTRQEMEVEMSHRQRFVDVGSRQLKDKTSLLIKSVQLEPQSIHPDHPINDIPKILECLDGRGGERESRRDRRRRRRLEKRRQYYQQFDTEEKEKGAEDGFKEEDSAKEDEEECEDDDVIEATCAPRPPDWVSTKTKRKKTPLPAAEEVEIDVNVNCLLKEAIAANRMLVEEIRKLPKFHNYSPGSVNKVLYVKNLSNKTCVRDLMELFGSFQTEGSPKLTFKLLTGKMRGQAFVTLPDITVAEEALNLINGYLLHGSPVIVSYGRKT